MKAKTICIVFVGILLFGLNSLQADGPRWNDDILIYEGPVSCFDVDYTMDGIMFLGFQKDESPLYPIYFYTSTNYGYTWNLKYQTPSLGRIAKMKILVGEPVHNYLYFFFVSPVDNYPYVWRIASDFSGSGEGFIIDSVIADEAGFDAARAIKDNYSMVFACTNPDPPFNWYWIECYRSTDYGETWSNLPYGFSTPDYARQEISIAWGPPSNYYLAYPYRADPAWPSDSVEIKVFYSLNDGVSWNWTDEITSNSRRDSDPHIAASHDPNNPAIWVAETYLYGGNDANLYVRSVLSPDSIESTWASTLISNTTDSEYWGDIKFYKSYGNPYVNMAWVYDDASTTRDVHWTWSNGGDPTTWLGDIVINDHMAHPWPFGAAPKVVYAPGSPGGGGAVVYAGFGNHNLYFDAPWNMGVEENVSSTLPHFSIYPNLLTANTPVKLSLSKKGHVEVTVYDVSGRLVYYLGPVLWDKGNHLLSLNHLNNGVYFLEFEVDGCHIGKEKLVILR